MSPLVIQFPDIEDASVSFTIKEESPDEALWISESVGPISELTELDIEQKLN